MCIERGCVRRCIVFIVCVLCELKFVYIHFLGLIFRNILAVHLTSLVPRPIREGILQNRDAFNSVINLRFALLFHFYLQQLITVVLFGGLRVWLGLYYCVATFAHSHGSREGEV